MKKLAIAATIAFSVTSVAHAQNRKVPVKVVYSGNDVVGKLYVSALRDDIARSPRFYETAEDKITDANGKLIIYPIVINIVSLDPSPDNNGHATAVSEVITFGGYFITQQVRAFSDGNADEVAKETLSDADAVEQEFKSEK